MHTSQIISFSKFIVSVFYLLCITMSSSYSQTDKSIFNLKRQFDRLYGLDPVLYNGIKYVPDHPYALGHPYLLKNEPFDGELIISGKNYKQLKLQYNCFKQEFILNYFDQNNAYNAIIINSNIIDTVIINKQIFVPCNIPDFQEAFLQLIYSGPTSCFITWKKEFNFIGTGAQTGFKYSNDIKKIYIQKKNAYPTCVNNKHSFLNIYENPLKRNIKIYLSENNIRFRKITDEELLLLMEFCNNQPFQ